jgi:hypothetical protein
MAMDSIPTPRKQMQLEGSGVRKEFTREDVPKAKRVIIKVPRHPPPLPPPTPVLPPYRSPHCEGHRSVAWPARRPDPARTPRRRGRARGGAGSDPWAGGRGQVGTSVLTRDEEFGVSLTRLASLVEQARPRPAPFPTSPTRRARLVKPCQTRARRSRHSSTRAAR